MRAVLLLFTLGLIGSQAWGAKDEGIQFILNESSEERKDDEKGAVSAYSDAWIGPAILSYSLTSSSGNSVKLPAALGSSMGAALRFSVGNGKRIRLGAEKVEARYSTVSGYTSAPLRVRHYDGRLSLEIPSNRFMFRPGYRLQLRDVQETGQVALMTKAVMHGFDFAARYNRPLTSRWKSEFAAGLFVPVQYDEKFQSTGVSALRFGVEASGGITYDWTKRLQIGFRPEASLFLTRFKGTGSRSVSDAKERWVQAKFPVEVAYAF